VLLYYLRNQKTRKLHLCTLVLHAFTKNARSTLKYHVVVAEPPVTLKKIDWAHQTGPRKHSILLSVTHTLYVYQVCHCVGGCVKDGSCSSASLE